MMPYWLAAIIALGLLWLSTAGKPKRLDLPTRALALAIFLGAFDGHW